MTQWPKMHPLSLSRRALLRLGGSLAPMMWSAARAQGSPPPAAPPESAPPAPPPERVMAAESAPLRLKPEPSEPAALWLFDGKLEGPVLRVKHGETLRLKLENRTPRPLALHPVGLRQPQAKAAVAGLSPAPVPPGGSELMELTPQDSGIYLLRPLVLGASSELAARGLGAMILVEEKEPPKADQDIALLVQDWLLTPEGGMAPFTPEAPSAAGAGRLGNWLTVNGKPAPLLIEARPGARLRLRLGNLCNARTLRIRFDDLAAHVIAIDGQPTDVFEPLRSTLPMAPGNRFDLMVDVALEEGKTGVLTALIGNGAPLARIVAKGEPMSASRPSLPPPAPLPPNPLLPVEVRLQNATRPELVIEGGAKPAADGTLDLAGLDRAHPWRVNGQPGAISATPLFSVKRGAPIVLALINRTAWPQPLHVHGHSFRYLHPLDDGWEPYFLDTVILPEGKTIRIAFIADQPGRWLISSAVLERFDAGLWCWFEVT